MFIDRKLCSKVLKEAMLFLFLEWNQFQKFSSICNGRINVREKKLFAIQQKILQKEIKK